MVAIAIVGFSGKMGQKVFELIQSDDSLSCVNHMIHSKEEITTLAEQADVIVDFSHPKMLPALLQAGEKTNTPIVSGTTGFSLEDKQMLISASQKIPILHSTNFSIGIALCHLLLEKIAPSFGQMADIDIVEAHHKHKKDAPSGTALSLKETLKKYLPEKEISLHSIRAGSIVGEHNMQFNTEEEQITLSHRALTRHCFARGALLAAKFIHGKEKGMYSIFDMFTNKEEVKV